MSIFSDIPVRANGQTILASWFNTVRSKLVLFFGTESFGQTTFNGLASQSGTNITGLIFDSATTLWAEVIFSIETATLFQKGSFSVRYFGGSWSIENGLQQFDNAGITFSVNSSTGQVTYSSGGETFEMNYRVSTMDT